MNHTEAENFVKSNTQQKIAETLVQQAETIKQLKSQINGDEYWVKVYCGHLLSNPELVDHDSFMIRRKAERMVTELNAELNKGST